MILIGSGQLAVIGRQGVACQEVGPWNLSLGANNKFRGGNECQSERTDPIRWLLAIR